MDEEPMFAEAEASSALWMPASVALADAKPDVPLAMHPGSDEALLKRIIMSSAPATAHWQTRVQPCDGVVHAPCKGGSITDPPYRGTPVQPTAECTALSMHGDNEAHLERLTASLAAVSTQSIVQPKCIQG
jgi:hypothetical protein